MERAGLVPIRITEGSRGHMQRRHKPSLSYETRLKDGFARLTSNDKRNILASLVRLPQRFREAMMPLPRLDTQAHTRYRGARRGASWEMEF